MIIQKRIRRLSFSGCNLSFNGPINISYQLIDLYDLDISNTTFITQGNISLNGVLMNKLFPSLNNLDASLLQTRLLDINYEFLQKTTNYYGCNESQLLIRFLFKITDLKINRILSRSVQVNGSFINLSKCQINTQSLQIRSNHLHYLNVTILWPKNTPLINVDLSSNDIEYLSPSFLGSATSLEILNLSDNQLHLMDSLIEFRYLFTKHKKLRHLDISRNSIKLLPLTIFSYNLHLTTLDLSHNKLTSISFNLKNLLQLQFLNLRNNEIYHIDGKELNSLNAFVAESSSQPRVIYFEHNRFICNCKSSRFIKWLHVYMTNNYTQILTCSLNDKDDVLIDDAVIKEAEFSCIRSKVIIASVLTVVSIITLVSLAICFIIYKRRKQERMRKRGYFITNFKLGNVPEKYLCFVSYSSEDYKADIRQVTARTKESLQELIQTSKEVLCVIDEHVNLGFPIVDEIMRCIKESCVGLFFVTTNFCQSQWCEMELRETYELNKPIILIFKEEIDTRIMSPLMLKIFQQFTRGKLVVTEHGDIQMIPDIQELSNSILKLASLRYNGNIEVNKTSF
ncbi:toll-like receptor 4 [Ruditapes philippinarum]|uniref:toll-like receptor 4 n=1 Tax=Ruditapes philippinarum TaxID=129788 RepID=UPI00295BFC91|nr:toll-like receptor 4 [Ruditapes philippinarum]